MLERRTGESELQYHRRLIYGKLIDKTLADADYTELAPLIYGQEYSADVARRMMYGSCKTLQAMDSERESAVSDNDVLAAIEQQKVELRKEQQKFFDQRMAFNKAVRDAAREDELKEILERTIVEGNLPRLRYEPKEAFVSDNDLIVSLNDIHYGASHENFWGTYNSDVCKRMFGRYIDAISAIGRTHNSQRCIVTANGDMLSGNLHKSIQVTNKENIIEQITGVSELIAQFLGELSERFVEVCFVSVAGNHSRLEKKEDAVLQERLDDLIEWYLRARMAGFKNVRIGYGEKIDCTMYLMDVRGKTYLGVHGDYEASISSVTSLQAMVGRPIYAVLMGHRHHNATDTVQGIKVVQSGSFLGTDNYCISRRLYGWPEQIVCVADESGIRCHYDVDLRVDKE